jgi:hypothetical protein
MMGGTPPSHFGSTADIEDAILAFANPVVDLQRA